MTQVSDSALVSAEPWTLLSLLRFVLASIVAINHLAEYVDLGVLRWVPRLGAFEAILGFLLISGYSIGASYLRTPQGFIWRRIRRVYPIYVIALFTCWCVATQVQRLDPPTAFELLVNLLLLNQVFTTTSYVGPAWSLALEFWLYVATPLLVLRSEKSLRSIVALSFVAYLVYTVLRPMLHLPYYAGVGYGANLLFLSFAWIGGLRLAIHRQTAGVALQDLRLIFAAHLLWSVAIQLAWRVKHDALSAFVVDDLAGFALQSLTLLIVYQAFARGVMTRRLVIRRRRLVLWLGDISYPLFLLHIPVFTVLAKLEVVSPIGHFGVALLFAAGAEVAVGRLRWTRTIKLPGGHRAF